MPRLLLFLLTFFLSVPWASSADLLLVSIDGMRPDYVLEADAHGLQIPHLRRLLAEGAHATGVRGVLPTVTYPSHTTILTGVWPAKHGIYTNTTFDPLGGARHESGCRSGFPKNRRNLSVHVHQRAPLAFRPLCGGEPRQRARKNLGILRRNVRG